MNLDERGSAGSTKMDNEIASLIHLKYYPPKATREYVESLPTPVKIAVYGHVYQHYYNARHPNKSLDDFVLYMYEWVDERDMLGTYWHGLSASLYNNEVMSNPPKSFMSSFIDSCNKLLKKIRIK